MCFMWNFRPTDVITEATENGVGHTDRGQVLQSSIGLTSRSSRPRARGVVVELKRRAARGSATLIVSKKREE
jgi:hypothetical protein